MAVLMVPDHFERQRGEERHAQHLKRCVAVLLADAPDQDDLVAAAVEQLQCGQTLQDVEEVRAHPAQRGPLSRR